MDHFLGPKAGQLQGHSVVEGAERVFTTRVVEHDLVVCGSKTHRKEQREKGLNEGKKINRKLKRFISKVKEFLEKCFINKSHTQY